jgi:hypothetical protein
MDKKWKERSEWIESLQFPSGAFMVLQAVIALACLWFWLYTPAPGWAVAIIAFAAASMSIQNDMKGWQKAIWMLLIGILLIVELRAITKDRTDSNARLIQARADQDAAFHGIRETENSNFRATAKGLETAISTGKDEIAQSQRQFTATADKLDQNLRILTETLNQTRPSAYVEFSRFNFLQSEQETWSGRDFKFQALFVNNGSDSANDLWKFGRFYLADPDEAGTKAAVSSFQADWIANKRGPSFLARGETRIEEESQKGFGASEIKQVLAHHKVILFFFRAEHSDKTGRWGSLSCREFFDPLLSDEIHCPSVGITMLNEPHFKIEQH